MRSFFLLALLAQGSAGLAPTPSPQNDVQCPAWVEALTACSDATNGTNTTNGTNASINDRMGRMLQSSVRAATINNTNATNNTLNNTLNATNTTSNNTFTNTTINCTAEVSATCLGSLHLGTL